MDFEKMILDHVTVPKPPVTEIGWRVRIGDIDRRAVIITGCALRVTRFEITTDDGDTWTTTHFWEGTPNAGAIVRAGYAIFAQYPGARVVEYEEINGTWIPRIEEEEAE